MFMKMEWPDAYCAKKGWTPERYRRKTKRNSNGQQKGERNRGKNKNETQRERERERERESAVPYTTRSWEGAML